MFHLGGKTSGATVFTPFAWAMRAHGLSGSKESVQSAIEGVKTDGVDSDGDGVPDWQEIVDGTDPNAPGTAKDIQDPQLGCAVGGGPGGRAGAVAASAILLVSVIRRRRR
ncbi:MAG: thrombospondin type 3 repeat-containing protein [Pseudomonadota bacterium]